LDPPKNIQLYWWHAPQANREFMFWLEPHKPWKERNLESAPAKSKFGE
jgi:hypothetical protein